MKFLLIFRHMADLYLDDKPISEQFCHLNSLISL